VTRRLGLSICRHTVAVVGLCLKRGSASISFSYVLPRGNALPQALASVLENVPAQWRRCDLFLALSAGDFACCDIFSVPFATEQQIEHVAGSLAEGRSAGASLEEIAFDIQCSSASAGQQRVQIAAVLHENLSQIQQGIRAALPDAKLLLVTPCAVAFAAALASDGVHAIAAGGECVIVRRDSGALKDWRSLPVNNASKDRILQHAKGLGEEGVEPVVYSETISFHGIEVSSDIVFACAAALCDPQHSLNVLRGSREAPRGLIKKMRRPLLLAQAAAAILLLSSGLYFEMFARRYEAQLQSCDGVEKAAWQAVLPGEKYRPGALTPRLKKILAKRNKTMDANNYPSALAFWSEVASVFPNADQMGMALESLQLGPDGGRITGRVNKGSGDPLANAALLESSLNNSESIAARGEYETKESEIVVRMRLDYKPPVRGAKSMGGSTK